MPTFEWPIKGTAELAWACLGQIIGVWLGLGMGLGMWNSSNRAEPVASQAAGPLPTSNGLCHVGGQHIQKVFEDLWRRCCAGLHMLYHFTIYHLPFTKTQNPHPVTVSSRKGEQVRTSRVSLFDYEVPCLPEFNCSAIVDCVSPICLPGFFYRV